MRGWAILILSCSVVGGALTLAGALSSLPVFLLAGLAGAALGELLRKSLPIEAVVLYPVMVFFTGGCLMFLVHGLLTEQAPFTVLETHMAGAIRENLQVYGMLGLPPEQLQEIRDQAAGIARFFALVAPAVAISMAALILWINVLVGGVLIRQRGGTYPEWGDLTLWKSPERTVWFLIAAGGAMLTPLDPVRQIGLNVLVLCLFVYLFQGLAIAACYFRRKSVPVFFRYLFYGLVFAQQYVALTVAVLGLADLWLDIRKHIRVRGAPS
jgi:uncharacterized protein YybS (DUF2232 family)